RFKCDWSSDVCSSDLASIYARVCSSVLCVFNLKKKNCLGNKKSLSLMSSIVALCLKKKKKYQFRHRYRFKSIGLAPILEKTQTIPKRYPSLHITSTQIHP